MLSSRLLKLRTDYGITQSDVAKAIGISYISIGNYENGTRIPNADVIIKLAQYFNVSTDYLLGLSKYKNTGDEKDFKILSESIAAKLNQLDQSEKQRFLYSIEKTIEYITRAKKCETAELTDRLGSLISFYGDMILKSFECNLGSENMLQHSYLLFLKYYERCINLLNEHRAQLLNSVLESSDNDTKLRKLFYGTD